MHVQRFGTLLVIACVVSNVAAAHAQADEPEETKQDWPFEESRQVDVDPQSSAEETRLGELLDAAATNTKRFRNFSGWLTFASGASLLSLGLVRLVQDPGNNQIQRGVGLLWLSIGTSSLTTGLVLLSRPSPEEGIRRRWRERHAYDEPLSEWELGSFAGELRAAAEFRRRERTLVRWVAVSGVVGGTLALSLIPVMNNLNDSSKRNVFVIGGIYTGVSLLNLGLSFIESGTEDAWQEYKKGYLPSRSRREISLAPAVYPKGGGLSLVGRF